MGELKPGWKRVKFGEVVRLGKERCDPVSDGIERYIGLEHIEPGDLRVRSWGAVSDGTTFTTRVRPGQVLFGKRRAYQRKVAVADFDAVCSGDIYVFESANPAKLLPGLLPFLCQTNAFFDYAVGSSAGSLSPRTNWTSLAEYEFALPPLEEQWRLLNLLRATATVHQAHSETLEHARRAETAWLLSAFADGAEVWPRVQIGTAGDLQLGLKKEREYDACIAPKPFLRVVNVSDGQLLLDDVRTMDFPGHRFERHRLKSGDVLLTEGDIVSAWNVGRAAVFCGEIEDCCIQNTLYRFRPAPGLDSWYALAAFRHMRITGGFIKAAMTTTVTHLVDHRLRKLYMPVPDAHTQARIASELLEFSALKRGFEHRARMAQALVHDVARSVWG